MDTLGYAALLVPGMWAGAFLIGLGYAIWKDLRK